MDEEVKCECCQHPTMGAGFRSPLDDKWVCVACYVDAVRQMNERIREQAEKD